MKEKKFLFCLFLALFLLFFSAFAAADTCQFGAEITGVSIKSDTGWTVDVDSTTDMDLRVNVSDPGSCTLDQTLKWQYYDGDWYQIPVDGENLDCSEATCSRDSPSVNTYYQKTITCVSEGNYNVRGEYTSTLGGFTSDQKTLACEAAVVPEFDLLTVLAAIGIGIGFIGFASYRMQKSGKR